MRLIDRRDTPLAIALIVGTATMFAQPLRLFLSVAEEVSRAYHVDLIPGFIIFVLVFTVHFWRKYRDISVEVQRASGDAEQAKRTAEEMERLVTASHAIASALDLNALRTHAYTQLPPLLGAVPLWVAVRQRDGWSWLIEPSPSGDALLEKAPALLRSVETGSSVHDRWVVVPLGTITDAVGLLGVDASAVQSPADKARIDAIAAVLGIAIRNVHLVEQLQTTSAIDPLTGCVNRAYGFQALNSELRRARRTGSPLTVLMLDVDGFKAVNDEHGHIWGDRALASIGDTLQRTLRTSDVKCRYGGDEFLIILPETPPAAAQHVVANVRHALQQIHLQAETGTITCSMSIGMAAAEPDEVDVIALVHRADAALYADKARVRPFLRPATVLNSRIAAGRT